MKSALFSLVAACAFVANACFAQELPKPGPEHEKLQAMVGEWDCVMEMDGQKSKCKASYKSICGGMWIASDFEGTLGPMKFQGHGLDGYDATKKKYTGVWVDSMTGSPMTLEGTLDKDGKTMVMTGEATGHDGKPEKVKTVTVMKDKDHFTFNFFMVKEGKEIPAFTIEYTRKK